MKKNPSDLGHQADAPLDFLYHLWGIETPQKQTTKLAPVTKPKSQRKSNRSNLGIF